MKSIKEKSGRRAAFGDIIPLRMIRIAAFYDGTDSLFSSSAQIFADGVPDILVYGGDRFMAAGKGFVRAEKLKFGIDDFSVMATGFSPSDSSVPGIICSNRDSRKKCAYGFTVSAGGGILSFAMGDGEREYEWRFALPGGVSDICLRIYKQQNIAEAYINGVKSDALSVAEAMENGFFTLDALDLCIGADGLGRSSHGVSVRDFYIIRGIVPEEILKSYSER